ncbi:DUF924 family protein [Chamaesiphon polymorphus]|uniref:DUF924 domain-containing protein n=1 Tax=Chamaesiphon polymorphus CCALA 037 TaxID=2107692 RepID=A0A2T1GCU9_9CYAN|nr:DUF924 family protein [Chamaesiphon polymorphus]PSB55249.1 DUF924 domain-containing protein [Chamaesiphon polymorphus CCALA 037]
MSRVDEILDFWFGTPDALNNGEQYGKPRSIWFKSDPIIDREIKDRFEEVYHFAAAGLLDGWKDAASSCLALIITLDQFPRNIFRGTPTAFATDALALSIAKHAIETEIDRELLPVQRWFIYLPFEHSENIEDQLESVKLIETLTADPDSQIAIDSARTHYELIKTFGRFPHRNQILGRVSTPAELEFLARPDAFHG